MNKQEFYQGLLVEAMKSYIKATAVYEKAREIVCKMKCDYVGGKIKGRSLIVSGTRFRPALVKMSFVDRSGGLLYIEFVADPETIRAQHELTRRESMLLSAYEENFYKKFSFESISQNKSNSTLLEECSELEYEINRLKNNINIRHYCVFDYSEEDMMDECFIGEKLLYEKQPLWI